MCLIESEASLLINYLTTLYEHYSTKIITNIIYSIIGNDTYGDTDGDYDDDNDDDVDDDDDDDDDVDDDDDDDDDDDNNNTKYYDTETSIATVSRIMQNILHSTCIGISFYT